MSQTSQTTTTYKCDLCGHEQEEKMAALYAPDRSLAAVHAARALYERCDICATCLGLPVSRVLAFFRRREG